MRCPACQAKNRAEASFCIQCGEPFVGTDGERLSLVEEPLTGGRSGGASLRLSLNPLRWGREVQIVVAVLLLFVVGDLVLEGQQKGDTATYHAGIAATAARQWHTATQLLKPLADKSYYDSGSRYRQASQQATTYDALYAQAMAAVKVGSQWPAFQLFEKANAIESDYGDLAAQQQAASNRLGRFIYRASDRDPAGAGLFLGGVEGGVSEQLPRTGVANLLYDIAPDGSRMLYSVSAYYRSFFIRDPNGSKVWPVTYPFGSEDGNTSVTRVKGVLVASGEGAVLIRDGSFGHRDPLNRTDLAYYPLGGGSEVIATADVVARPGYQDTILYYATSRRDKATRLYVSTIYGYNLRSGKATAWANVVGQVEHLAVVGDYLVYTTYDDSYLRVYLVGRWGRGLVKEFKELHPANPSAIEMVIGGNSHVFIYTTAADWYGRAWMLDVQSQNVRAFNEYDLPEGVISSASFSPDQQKLLLSGVAQGAKQDPWLVVVDMAGKIVGQRTLDLQLLYNVGFLQDSRHIYYISSPRRAVPSYHAVGTLLWDLAAPANNPDRLMATGDQPYAFDQPAAVNLTADGSGLVYINEGAAYISDLNGANARLLFSHASAIWPSRDALAPELPRSLPRE